MTLTIAIDGPVGAGKSTISDAVAKRLGILHLDTGAMYRAAGLYVLENHVDPADEKAVCALLEKGGMTLSVGYADASQVTKLNNRDVSSLIRTEEVGLAASSVSRYAFVRSLLVDMQREISRKQSMVVDGRDIGTVVLKDAPVKIFLTASPETRAQRRVEQLSQKGETADFDTVLADLQKRDEQDRTRPLDPLRQAEDAHLVDTSRMDFDQSVEAILAHVKKAFPTLRMAPYFHRMTPFFTFARCVLWLLLSWLYPARFIHRERLDMEAPYILVSNHQSFLDPPILALRVFRYEVRFLGKDSLRKNPILRFLVDHLHMIPVARSHTDMGAMRACLNTLKEGNVLAVFPEGTRKEAVMMEKVESGIGLIALRAKVSLVPVFFDRKPRLFRLCRVYVGEPIPYDDLIQMGVNKESCELLTARIREATYRLKNISENREN